LNAATFRLKYAPHFGMFRHTAGADLLDQLRFMHDAGFRALEDNPMAGRPARQQEAIADEMAKLGMEMGVFVMDAAFEAVTMCRDTPEERARLAEKTRIAIETAKRVNATWTTVVPGCYDDTVEFDYQTATVVEHLRRCCDALEPHGIVMVLEPINFKYRPNLFLTKMAHAHLICRAVDSPSCKILDDLYHQQITEGELIPNLEAAWSETAYIQVGDNPGRKEPGTGEINYRNIFGWLHGKGYDGIVGMEHGVAGEGAAGEQAVIEAYRRADDF